MRPHLRVADENLVAGLQFSCQVIRFALNKFIVRFNEQLVVRSLSFVLFLVPSYGGAWNFFGAAFSCPGGLPRSKTFVLLLVSIKFRRESDLICSPPCGGQRISFLVLTFVFISLLRRR